MIFREMVDKWSVLKILHERTVIDFKVFPGVS